MTPRDLLLAVTNGVRDTQASRAVVSVNRQVLAVGVIRARLARAALLLARVEGAWQARFGGLLDGLGFGELGLGENVRAGVLSDCALVVEPRVVHHVEVLVEGAHDVVRADMYEAGA